MIKLNNLNFGYRKRPLLFKDLNLQLKAGHIYGLLGKNGAGKSTLLKNLAGLVYPKSGTCTINGISTAKRLPSLLQELFFIPEEIYMPSQTAAQFAKRTAPFYPKFDYQQFNKALAEFDVADNIKLNALSFGQQKKAMIAFGLATNAAVLIMDEPTNGLDIPSKVQFRKIIASVLTDDRCIIISTHQIRDLDSLIDSLLVLHRQEVVLNMGLEEIAERIQFTTAIHANTAGIIYTEPNAFGINTISVANGHAAQKVDMEMLFNAIIDDSNKILTHLN